MPIQNGKNTPVNQQTGGIPNVGGALNNWFQPMVFTLVQKQTVNFQLVETETLVYFRGVIQPLSYRDLQVKPEGERAWTWLWLHAEPSLQLRVDDIVEYVGVRTRVMGRKNYEIYGYIEYQLCQDWLPAEVP